MTKRDRAKDAFEAWVRDCVVLRDRDDVGTVRRLVDVIVDAAKEEVRAEQADIDKQDRPPPCAPRPVRVDEEGRIFELSGEEIRNTGLSPAEVLQGISDAEQGRTRPFGAKRE